MWSFQDNYLHTSDEKPARPEPINVQAPVSISNIIPRSITEEQRDLWHTMLADVDNNIGTKTREEVYEEQKRQFYNDYYAGLEERLVSGKSQPTPSELYAFRLAREKWETKNLVGIENAYEYELANRKAFWDIMDNPEEYQYAKTGDTVEDTTNALTNDLILTRALYNKTKQIRLAEEILAQFTQESAAGYAGGSIGATAGGSVGGLVGAAVGAYVGANESIYQYRKAKIGHGTPSVNTVAEKFLEEYNALCNLYLNKTDFNKAVVGLVDKYLTDRNWDYWGDISTVILSGQRSFLDLGPLTGLLISTGLKGIKGIYKGLRPALGPKTMKQATQQAVKDAQALQVYKQRKANGEDVVYDGEIVSGQILKNSDNASPNAGMSQEGITIDAESWTTYEPGGEIIMTYVNPKTGDIVRYKSFRNIGSGSVSLIGDMKKQNMLEEIGTSVGVKDIDSTLDNDVVTLVGTGADYTQPFESVRAAEKALARWNIQLKDNQVPVVVEQGTDQYYLGVVDVQEPYFDLGIATVEDLKEGGKVFWHEKTFETYDDALEYVTDLKEMEDEGKGLTPVSAGSANRFKEFKNKEKTGWDRDHPAYFAPGNYLSLENIGSPLTTKKVNLGEIREILPESRYGYFQNTVRSSLMDLVDTKEFDEYVEKTLKGINHSHFKHDKEGAIGTLDWAWSRKGPDGFIEFLKDSTKDLNDARIKERYKEIPKENADEEIYEMLLYKYVLDNIDKVKTNLMSTSVNTPDIVQVSGEEYIKLSDEARRYLMNLTGLEKELSDYVYYDIKDRMLSPIGEQDTEAMRITDVMHSIVDKLIFKNPVKYTGDTLQELEKKISENRFGADIKIDYKALEKDLTKAYKKLLKENNLEVLGHEEGSNIVVSNPKKINKVSKIETITAKGKYIQEVVDNDYVIRYNKETGGYQIGEVRGGKYKLKQDVKDMGIWQ